MDKILVVDSTIESAELVSKYLARNGYDIIIAGQLKGLFVNLKLMKPDLIILDSEIVGEGGSGYDFCKKLKEENDTKYIPVLMTGTSDSANSLRRALESGADDYMPKTYEAYVIISKIKSLIRIKHLGDELKSKYTEIEEKNKLIEMQLKMAMQVQQSLIKECQLNYNGVRLVSKYKPALEIGGDFYDIVELSEDIIAVVMGDVSGHGISAALLTAMLNMMIRTLSQQYYNPAQFLYFMNKEIYSIFKDSSANIYACMFYAVIDTKRKRIDYSNAGQALPIFINNHTQTASELDAAGAPLGMMENSEYEHKMLMFEENDLLLFYTDGLMDNLYKNHEEEFYKRMVSMLIDLSDGAAPEVIIDSLLSVFYKFDMTENMKYEMDDVSLILCKM
ncbi:MAG: fused response regulator/phosphatase [Clostridiales bacterium]|jgi:sigma-B regulation protein RsbU (phosphoserine phosphatase)|nr:fused response regulator/phosphatase [Clostridiales bacterium]